MKSFSESKKFTEPGSVFGAVIRSGLQCSVLTHLKVFCLYEPPPGTNGCEVVVFPLITEVSTALVLLQVLLSCSRFEQLLAVYASA